MSTNPETEDLGAIAGQLASCNRCTAPLVSDKSFGLAGRQAVFKVLEDLIAALFPGCHGYEPVPSGQIRGLVEEKLHAIRASLRRQIELAYRYQCEFEECKDCGDCGVRAEKAIHALMVALPDLKCVLQEDIVAAYEGDPAAKSFMEVVMSYPGVMTIMTHRLAHVLYLQQVPLIPRIMSEHAHSQTGIDIHPGAEIGPGFFIDHGTGVVIGETCNIGRRVKLYQGVTLGALSFPKDDKGNPIKGIKRHPNVEDDVTIYAGATILGGTTTIGAGAEIGGNVWLTHSVPPGAKVYNQQPQPLIRERGKPKDNPPGTAT
ncbi:MAG: serine O-acetyltransferase EpsC [Kiritimatiellia bacterium]